MEEETGHTAVPCADHDTGGEGVDRLVGNGLVTWQDLDPRIAAGMIDWRAEDRPFTAPSFERMNHSSPQSA